MGRRVRMSVFRALLVAAGRALLVVVLVPVLGVSAPSMRPATSSGRNTANSCFRISLLPARLSAVLRRVKFRSAALRAASAPLKPPAS